MDQFDDALTTLASQYENAFCYNLETLDEKLDELLDQDVATLWYAVKANPLSAIIKRCHAKGMRFDVASIGELDHVLAQGVDPAMILHTGPAKSRAQLNYFLEQGIRTFVCESINQVQNLNALAADLDEPVHVLLRVQLRYEQTAQSVLGGNQLTPFGLSPLDWHALNASDHQHLNIKGFHVFQWGNVLTSDTLAAIWLSMLEPLNALSNTLNVPFDVLDLGGGLGLPYEAQQEALAWQDVVTALGSVKEAFSGALWMELGRYAVGDAGVYLNRIIDKKTNHQHTQLIASAGINHLLRPQVAGQPFPCQVLGKMSTVTEPMTVHGPLCTALDELGTFSLPASTQVGDTLIFNYTGAYGFTESMPFFLGHTIAPEYVWQQGKLECVREAMPASWYLR